ncbi:hypothetical protein V6O07_01220 [Arthrospira platensis SPKY2]
MENKKGVIVVLTYKEYLSRSLKDLNIVLESEINEDEYEIDIICVDKFSRKLFNRLFSLKYLKSIKILFLFIYEKAGNFYKGLIAYQFYKFLNRLNITFYFF